ncbi:MAG: hypothetical protein HQK83_09580 [Fibrobacteria bacterium]|nr:hypothetical protein [Fibrobacteria bacterium]
MKTRTVKQKMISNLIRFSFFLMFMFFSMLSAEKLYVFYPSPVRPHHLQKTLREACPNLEITVFGRFEDFADKVKSHPPDAILSKPEILKSFANYFIHRSGSKDGESNEKYVLLSIDKDISVDSLSSLSIGFINLMGRKNTKLFLSEQLNATPKIKLVTKVEDFLPLQRFGMVDAVLIPETFVAYFTKNSNLKFTIADVPQMRPAIVAIAVSDSIKAEKILKAINGLPLDKSIIFGVDSWQ